MVRLPVSVVAPVPRFKLFVPVKVTVPPTVIAGLLATLTADPDVLSSVPAVKVRVPVPKALLLLTSSVPAVRVTSATGRCCCCPRVGERAGANGGQAGIGVGARKGPCAGAGFGDAGFGGAGVVHNRAVDLADAGGGTLERERLGAGAGGREKLLVKSMRAGAGIVEGSAPPVVADQVDHAVGGLARAGVGEVARNGGGVDADGSRWRWLWGHPEAAAGQRRRTAIDAVE